MVLVLSACSGDTTGGGTGGARSTTGGTTSSTTGGTTSSTGGANSGTGGSMTTGGVSPTTGGLSSTTGGVEVSAGSGGVIASGGTSDDGAPVSGGTSNGGASVSGGTSGGGSAGAPPTCTITRTGSATRPQLTDASASCFTLQRYFAQAGTIGSLVTDNWDPSAGLPAASTFTPTFTVAQDGTGTHATVSAAIAAAHASTAGSRVYILIKPGEYRELVCVKGTVPITLYGADADASKVTVAFNNYSGKAINTAETNACALPSATAATYGTSGSTTFFVSSDDFQAMNLTIANDFDEKTASGGFQAVALNTTGDKLVFQNVRVIGNQDTLMVKTPNGTVVSRAYFKNSYIEGDTDFIFGRGTAVFDGCTITYVSTVKRNSTHISPSTEQAHPFGFLIVDSKILGDAGMPTGSAATALLGRAWDDTSATAPNGQALIRNTEIAGHIVMGSPWTESTQDRAFNADTNRFYEYENTGAGAVP